MVASCWILPNKCHEKPDVVSCTYIKENKSWIERRYGPKEAEMVALGNCARCRGKCNCSVCRKKKGLQATGILTRIQQRKYIEMAECAREQLKVLEGQESLMPKG